MKKLRLFIFLFPSILCGQTIKIISPLYFQTYQRDSTNHGSIVIWGTYTSNRDTLEASWNNLPYQIMPLAVNDTFNYILTNLPAGQGILYVRNKLDTFIYAEADRVGIGDIYVTAGQSNMVGHGQHPQQYTLSPSLNIKPTVYDDDGLWRDCIDPTSSLINFISYGGDSGTLIPLLGSRLRDADSVPISFIICAVGASGLVDPPDWTYKDSTGQHLFERMLQHIASSGVNSVKAVIWDQGTQDADNHVTYSQYIQGLYNLGNNIHNLIPGSPDLYEAQSGYHIDLLRVDLDAIRTAQRDSWDTLNIKRGPLGYDITDLPDGEHYTTNQQLDTIALRWFIALKNLELPPKLQSANLNRTMDTVILTFDKNISECTGGFEVYLNGDSEDIISVNKISSNQVGLQVSPVPANSQVTTSLGSGNDAYNNRVPHELVDSLPSDIFVQVPVIQGVYTGLQQIDLNVNQGYQIFDILGQEVNLKLTQLKGLYIVKQGNTVSKVFFEQ